MEENVKKISIDELSKIFEKSNYVADKEILITTYLALKLNKPLLIEGDPGCGKTEIAKVLASGFNTELIRLQCYEGLDVNSTIYEWDYLRQLLKIRLEENKKNTEQIEGEIFSEKYLLKRPILKALLYSKEKPAVLLIDEVDRADEEFESFLLEFLGEFQVTIPELGSFKAEKKPIVVLTSNRTRELGDGLRRRCIYLYITFPSYEKEISILRKKVNGLDDYLASQIVSVVGKIRSMKEIIKKPGVSETIDWANALLSAGKKLIDNESLSETIGCLVKSPEELLLLKERIPELLAS